MSTLEDIRIEDQMVPVKINGKELKILFDFNAYAEIEKSYGDLQGLFKVLSKCKFSDLLKLLCIGLSHEDENITEKSLGKMITPANMVYISEKLGEAITLSLPQVETNSEVETEEEKKSPTIIPEVL